jgi:hypothetical protein
LNSLPIEAIIDKARYNFSGDTTVTVQIRRLEVSLRPEGWRGNAEMDIQLEDEYLAQRLTSRVTGRRAVGEGEEVSLLGFTDSMAEQKKREQQPSLHEAGSMFMSVMTERSSAESKY